MRKVKRILFICKHNRFRSKVAEAFFNKYQKIDAPPHLKRCGLNCARFLDDRSADHILKDVVLGRHCRHNKNKDYVAISAGLLPGRYPLDKLQTRVAKKFGLKLNGKPKAITTEVLMKTYLMVIVADNVPPEIFNNQKIDAPPRLKRRGLIGARFLDARSVPHTKVCGFQTLRHEKYGRKEIIWGIEDSYNDDFDETYKIISKIKEKVMELIDNPDDFVVSSSGLSNRHSRKLSNRNVYIEEMK